MSTWWINTTAPKQMHVIKKEMKELSGVEQ
jgi:hypothetical protein